MQLALRMFVYAFEGDKFLFWLVVKDQFVQLFVAVDLLEQFLAVVLEAVVADESLLDGFILLCDELANGHRHALLLGGGPAAVQFDVQGADHRLQVANPVLLLLDVDPKQSNFFLHTLDLFGVFLVFLLQFLEEVVCLFF